MMSKIKGILLTFLGIIIIIVIYKTFLSDITASSIRQWVDSFGRLAPLAYILVWIILPIFFFPVPVLALAGGLSFGLWDGTMYTLIGALVNSTAMYYLAKMLSRNTIRTYLKEKMPKIWWEKFMNANSRDSFFIVFICRLIPAMPYNVINYISGLADIKFTQYSIATLIGILPGTVIFLNVGDKILDIKSPEFIFSILLVVLLTLGSIFLAKRLSKQNL